MPRKVFLYIASSLDGYIARTDGSIDWLETDEHLGYEEFYQAVDTIIVGRKTYDQALTFGEFPYKGKKCFVFSRKTKKKDPYAEFINEDVKIFSERLKKADGRAIWLVGGARLIKAFYENDLIDEYIITVLPVILGNGIPLFEKTDAERKVRLVDIKKHRNGFVELRYSKLGEK